MHWGRTIAMRGGAVRKSLLAFLQSPRHGCMGAWVHGCMKEVFSYNCGFHSYYMPSTVCQALCTYFISFYSHKSFVTWVKHLHHIAKEAGWNVLPKVTELVLEGAENIAHVTWFRLMLFALPRAILWGPGNYKSPCDNLGYQPSEIRTHGSLYFLRWE